MGKLVSDEMYEEAVDPENTPLRKLQTASLRVATLEALLIRKGVFTEAEFDSELANITRVIDQCHAEIRDRFEANNPGAALLRKIFGHQ